MTPRAALLAADVAAAAQLACLLEASAPKPGNVSPFASFRDATYEDFLASAAAIGPALTLAGERSLGATIRAAVEATARWAPSNTNLGLVLLLAPLARAELRPEHQPLRARLGATLADTTVADARDAYVAIRSAAPGGLGRASEQDVAGTPTATLRDAMALARDRDAIAREYATDFATTFEIGAPGLRRALFDGLAWREAVVEVYLALLARSPDTHIVRKLGAGRDATSALDRELRDEANTLNPGTTADLTGASIYVVLLEGGWPFPGHRCEKLHGHNYRTRVVVEGGLDPEAHYVLDFSMLKDLMKRLTDEIDHRVLLPLQSTKIQVREEGETVRVAVAGKPRYVFPREDCALLPMPNTTVEMLAQYLAGRVSQELASSGGVALRAVEVEVEENFGQSATYRESLG